MGDVGLVVVLFAAGVLLLVAEVFIPSHGMLTILALTVLVAAIVKTFEYGETAGLVAVIACLVLLPTFAVLAVKFWYRTPVGRRIAPPNPVLTEQDTGVPVEEMKSLLGCTGRAVSPLRPVGFGEFAGRRVPCVAEGVMIDAGVAIKGVGVRGGQVVVVEKRT